MDDPAILRPRFALNTYCVGGLVFLVAGPFLVALWAGVPVIRSEAWWLVLMGVAIALVGLAWVFLCGRWGRMRESARARRDGVLGQALILDARHTGATTRVNRRITRQGVRLDLEIRGAGSAPYRLRVYRNLAVRHAAYAVPGQTVNVQVLPDRRTIALGWPEPVRSAHPVTNSDPDATITLTVDDLRAMAAGPQRWNNASGGRIQVRRMFTPAARRRIQDTPQAQDTPRPQDTPPGA